MKSRFLPLSILAAMAFSLVSFQAVSAQEQQQQRGARFNFAPNIWKTEEARIPNNRYAPAQPAHAVKHGSMPQSSNFLLDPSMIPEAPKPVIATAPTTNLSHQVSIPRTNAQLPKTNYQPAFGRPLSAPPMAVASLPPQAMAPITQAAKPAAMKSAPIHAAKHVSASLRHNHARTGVSGRLLTRTHPVGQSAPVAASYGKNFGYQPGGYLPTQSGTGVSTRSEVSGRILH